VNPAARRLSAGPLPIGDSAVDVAVGPDNRAFVTSFSDGLYVFDASRNTVLRGSGDPLFAPDSLGEPRGSSGVAVDRRGQVLSVHFGTGATPGQVFLFGGGRTLADSAVVGVGPFGIQFEETARPD
jgi:hypothetical protein